MNIAITLQLAILFFLPGAAFSQYKQKLAIQDSATHISSKLKGGSLWGEINAGCSNHGVMGNLALSYRKGNLYFGTSYYKSHVCYHVTRQQASVVDIRNLQEHKTVQAISVLSGIIFPGKWTPSLSVGISWLQFDYEHTIPIAQNVTFERIWATITGNDYEDEKLNSHAINTIGIPIGFNLHFSPKHFAGVDATFNANLNTHSVIISGGLRIHLGRIIPRS